MSHIIFNNEYFEKNPIKIFILRNALIEICIKDEDLEDEGTVRRFLREGIGFRNRITSLCCESLRDYIRERGGVRAYLERPAFLDNIYVALAVYNMRIQNEINGLSTFNDLNANEAQLLVSDLLSEEEIADEDKANKFRALCSNFNYKKAEYAINKYVSQISLDQAILVKSYICNYIQLGLPPEKKYSAFQLALLQKNRIQNRPMKSSPCKSERVSEEDIIDVEETMRAPTPIEAHCLIGVQSPIQKAYVKVERLGQQELRRLSDEKLQHQKLVDDVEMSVEQCDDKIEQQTINDVEMDVPVDESMLVDDVSFLGSAEKKDMGVQTVTNVEKDCPSSPRYKLNNKRKKLSVNLVHVNKQRYFITLRQMEIEQREAAVTARELAVELRESAINFREKLAKRAKILAPDGVCKL